MQKGLNYLLEKYSVNVTAEIKNDKTVNIDGKDFPIMPWENERRFIELRNLVKTRLGNMSTYRIGNTDKANVDIFDLLEREIGILEFTVDSPVKEIFAIAGNKVMNCIAETENGCVCTIELATTLTENNLSIDKHEIITDNGVGCDRVVDTQIPQQSIYVLGEDKKFFTDTDAELFGYTERQINIIRNAFALSKDQNLRTEYIKKAEHIKKVVDCARESLKTMKNVEIK